MKKSEIKVGTVVKWYTMDGAWKIVKVNKKTAKIDSYDWVGSYIVPLKDFDSAVVINEPDATI